MKQKQNFDFSFVKNLRMKRGMTAETLAHEAGVTRATIAKLESGKGNPTIETLSALGKVFQMGASQLVEMAETGKSETGQKATYNKDGFHGIRMNFSGFELFHLEAPRGSRAVSVPDLHDNTAEICMVISGRVKITVLEDTRILKPGEAIRFKAIHDHELEALEDTTLLLIHHLLI
ncbi:helix-turn-helix domain-containing protein [Desulfotignum phosphitoxidans]|uniref:HTH/cupin2 domain-containing protein n=1 Tax=Desulfotignum phosphitoxidans DSM 13687 TaxID=1286635 RepID=S0G801_9BACT|nr:XRE family transcriptional regulator [Desulfotignum phosphitoxidans]EMS81336.1 HTH/cupin2 domain-containing protein [Desulfotignum phosphitoxidans DSM 13687]